MPLSWLQQTGNAPQQVMLQALFRCLLLAEGDSAHYCCSVFPSAPTMPPFFSVMGAAKELNHEHGRDKDALSQISPEI